VNSIPFKTKKDVSKRPTAKELLKHKFIKSAKKNQLLIELIEKKQNYFQDHPDEKFENVYSKFEGEKESKNEETGTLVGKKLIKDDDDDNVEFKWNFDDKMTIETPKELEEKETEEEKESEYIVDNSSSNSPVPATEVEDEPNSQNDHLTKRKVNFTNSTFSV
jgi:hypothetical protein